MCSPQLKSVEFVLASAAQKLNKTVELGFTLLRVAYLHKLFETLLHRFQTRLKIRARKGNSHSLNVSQKLVLLIRPLLNHHQPHDVSGIT